MYKPKPLRPAPYIPPSRREHLRAFVREWLLQFLFPIGGVIVAATIVFTLWSKYG
jgi:hypothetical protein